ncbi:bifunctional phosphopantothenoylcysteine decarboxylase/phosphopantothenate--cysteine ligase CoaBC [Thermodesulfovibrio sp.]|uniref:bifunctional phosphopantothenoylcysteine decarboxylase/phosphopantothenate--cysteine ligase CoaBC n=1 Tax=Thermodesulfovibrio sp. TaxID=2067987 RepID=UPI0030A8A592
MLKNKTVALGITGSIAAYKVFELIKKFKDAGADVIPVMTEKATYFVTPLSLQIASNSKVFIDMFESPLAHIQLAQKADLFLIAPATANFINKYATGIADDLLLTTLLAFRGPVIIAPAMNWRMYEAPQLQKNIDYLKSIGVTFVEPEEGSLACGEEGKGRLASIDRIFEVSCSMLSQKDLGHETILITAGPTRQYIDPIRFITNKSSGKMGYALAKIAKRRGAKVKLISGPTSISPPFVDEFVSVETTQEMLKAVRERIEDVTTLIMAAAPLDFEPDEVFTEKIDKKKIKSISLRLCPDILKEISKLKKKTFTVGFAAEWGFNIERAKRKLMDKSLDMIVLNDISGYEVGMGSEDNQIIIIYKEGEKFTQHKTPLLSKEEIAHIILSKIVELKIV